MEYGQLKRALEGVLFAAGEPVTAQRLCLGLEDHPGPGGPGAGGGV